VLAPYALLPILRNRVVGIPGVPGQCPRIRLAMGVTRQQILWCVETADQNGVRMLSDAAASPWRLAVGDEFTQRPDGLTALVQTYGLRIQGQPVVMDLGLLYAALKTDRIDLAAANATDGTLAIRSS